MNKYIFFLLLLKKNEIIIIFRKNMPNNDKDNYDSHVYFIKELPRDEQYDFEIMQSQENYLSART
jgi:hypothetical protein